MTKPHREKSLLLITSLLVAAAFIISTFMGQFPLSVNDIFTIITGGEISDIRRNVFFTLRLPRVTMALIAGAGLGMTGCVLQLVFKNPLASPGIIGVSSGANLGAAAAIVMFGYHARFIMPSAFLGGMLVVFAVIALARMTKINDTVVYVLAGIIMRSVSEAFIMMFKFYADPERQLASIEFWSMGSLANVTDTKVLAVLPAFLIGFFGLALLWRQIMMLNLNEEESQALGMRVGLIRTVVLALVALTVSAIVSVTGLISFIGLIAPHIAKLAYKRVNFTWCMLSALFGAFIMLAADSAARTMHTSEIPISILTTFIGVPFLLWFMYKGRLLRS